MEHYEIVLGIVLALLIGFFLTLGLLKTTWPSLSRKARTITSAIMGIILCPPFAYALFIAWAIATGYHG